MSAVEAIVAMFAIDGSHYRHNGYHLVVVVSIVSGRYCTGYYTICNRFT